MLSSPQGCELLLEPGALSNKWLQPLGNPARLLQCMSSVSGALPFPVAGGKTGTRTRVDHRNTDEAALVRRGLGRGQVACPRAMVRPLAKSFFIFYVSLPTHNNALI